MAVMAEIRPVIESAGVTGLMAFAALDQVCVFIETIAGVVAIVVVADDVVIVIVVIFIVIVIVNDIVIVNGIVIGTEACRIERRMTTIILDSSWVEVVVVRRNRDGRYTDRDMA